MLRKFSFTVFLMAVWVSGIVAQEGKLTGTVYGAESEPLGFVTVVVYEGDLVFKGTNTDANGFFSVNPIPAGVYNVEVRYLQNKKIISDVTVLTGQTRNLTITMDNDVTLDEVEIFGNPVFEKDPAVVTTLTGKELQQIGTRDVNSVAALQAGVFQSDEGDGSLSIRGARNTSNAYFIDGVKIRGQFTASQGGIQQFQVYTGGIPAEFGDFTGGVISITTANPSSQFSGNLELVTSEYLDAYGRNLAALTLSGPLITKKTDYGKRSILGFFFNGELDYNRDNDPAYLGIYKLNDDVLADLQQTPVEISPDNLTFRSRASFIGEESWQTIKAKQNNESLRVRGMARLDFQPTSNIIFKASGSYEFINTDQWGIGTMLFAPDPQSEFMGANYRGWARFQQTFSGGEKSLVRNLFYSIQADYQLYQRRFQNTVHQDNFFDYGYIGKFSFDEVPIYGYVSNPQDGISSSPYWQTVGYGFNNLAFDGTDSKNPLMANYNNTIFNHVAENGIVNLFPGLFTFDPIVYNMTSLNELAFRQGLLNGGGPRGVYSLFSGIGANSGGYSKFDFEQYRLTGQATAEIKGHNLKAGFEFEQRVERAYAIGARGLWGWMRQYANFHLLNLEDDPNNFTFIERNGEFQDTVVVPRSYSQGDQAVFDQNLRAKLGLPVDGTDYINIDALSPDFFSLDMFTADELLADGLGPISYYGFDYLGRKQARVAPEEFFTNEDLRPQNPFAPTYISAFIQDKFEFEDINFNVGLRVDRFDANQPVLKDNFSLYDTYTAGEVASGELGVPRYDLPSGISSDFVPYVNDASNFTEVLGYRDGEIWYDVNGAPVSSAVIAAASGGKPTPALKENEVTINSFEDYRPQTTFMPRISFSFPISDIALFFAHYDVLAQRPGQLFTTSTSLIAAQLSEYAFLENSPTAEVVNGNLKPEITVDYEAGFKQKIGETMALSMSAFYREQRNMIRFRRFVNAYPFSYDTYDNLDFGTVKGFSFSYDMRRTKNVSLRSSYTLQFADATGSSFSSARNIVNYLEGAGVLRVLLPVGTDVRHRIAGALDYRFARNPGPSLKLGGKTVHPLKEFGANVSYQITSGRPFTRNSDPVPAVLGGINIVNRVQGTPLGNRYPWTYRIDLRVDKNFALGGKVKEEGGKTRVFGFNIYLLMLNALNTQNILGVYRYTGLPEDDGFLSSDSGEQFTVTQIDPSAFVSQYQARLANPNNYSIPRRIRLGILFNF